MPARDAPMRVQEKGFSKSRAGVSQQTVPCTFGGRSHFAFSTRKRTPFFVLERGNFLENDS